VKETILKGTIEIKFNALGLEKARDMGKTDATIIHELLDSLLAQLTHREKVTFSDCEIKEVEGCKLPF